LAFDLDGTVVHHDGILTDRNAAALAAVQASGCRLIICTGRGPESAEPYRAAIGVDGPCVYYNGALVADYPANKLLSVTHLPVEAAAACVKLAHRGEIYLQIYLHTPVLGREVLMAEWTDEEALFYYRHTGRQAVIGSLDEALKGGAGFLGVIKAMFIAAPEKLDALRPDLDAAMAPWAASITRTHSRYLEVMADGVSKGSGLLTALNHYGITPADTLAMGDEENDLPLLQAAGRRAAPSNAKPSVLALADTVFGDCDEDGAAEFLAELKTY
jgi:Cof subfamily protein (haloacid dehalogenase superfamily)